MDHTAPLLVRVALLALLGLAAPCHAGLTPFTTQTSFLGAVTAPGVDTFSGLSTTAATSSPITRSAGIYTYSASSTTSFFGAGTAANPALSTNVDTDVIMLFSFSGGASAVGGLFFGSDILGNFVNATMVLTVTDSLGATLSQTFLGTPSTFIGFASTGTIATLSVTTAMPGQFVFPTVDNLTIAQAIRPVPEPESWALLGVGLAALGGIARRKRRR